MFLKGGNIEEDDDVGVDVIRRKVETARDHLTS